MVPQGTMKVISDAGHLLPESHPAEAVAAIADFVQSLRKK
jgi:pimeloyl-ACP methyl ester carboxylesterase